MIEYAVRRLRQLYLFLKEANQLRFPPVRTLSQHPRVLRLADARRITRACRSLGLYAVKWPMARMIVRLRVRRPSLVTCPPPPAGISQWLPPDWAEPAQALYSAQHRNAAGTDGAALTIRFEDDAAARFRVRDLVRAAADQWAAEEVAARQALNFFELFYEIHSAIERDGGELLELVAADGRLSWRADSSIEGAGAHRSPDDAQARGAALRRGGRRVQHPRNGPADRGSTARCSRTFRTQRPRHCATRTAELDNGEHHPWGARNTESLFEDAGADVVAHQRPPVARSASPTSLPTRRGCGAIRCSYCASASGGIANAVDAIIDDIDQRTAFSRRRWCRSPGRTSPR